MLVRFLGGKEWWFEWGGKLWSEGLLGRVGEGSGDARAGFGGGGVGAVVASGVDEEGGCGGKREAAEKELDEKRKRKVHSGDAVSG